MLKLCSVMPVFRSVMTSFPHGAEDGVIVNPKSNMFTSTLVVCGFAHVFAAPELEDDDELELDAELEPDLLEVEPVADALADAGAVTLTPTPIRPFIPAPA